MLEHSFIHVPGIGPHRERELWVKGFIDWDTFLKKHPKNSWREMVAERLNYEVALETLPRREAWRTFPNFSSKVVYLDIETEGLNAGREKVTCVGLSDGQTVEAYVQGENLDQLPDALSRYEMIVTYNGSQFDLPVLAAVFPSLDFTQFRHIDLRFVLKRLGFRGGLKAAEKQVGLARGGGVEGLDGYFAIVLWREHLKGTAGARDSLLRYCLEDVVNLKPLLAYAYNEMTRQMPIEIEPIVDQQTPEIPWSADLDLVQRLANGLWKP